MRSYLLRDGHRQTAPTPPPGEYSHPVAEGGRLCGTPPAAVEAADNDGSTGESAAAPGTWYTAPSPTTLQFVNAVGAAARSGVLRAVLAGHVHSAQAVDLGRWYTMIRLSTHLCCSPLLSVWPSCKLSAHTAELHLTVRYVVCLSVCLRRVACQSIVWGARWAGSALA